MSGSEESHSTLIVIAVVSKIFIISFFLGLGIRAYWLKESKMLNRKGVICLMSFIIFILLCTLCFDLGTKYIFAYYLLQVSVNYAVMCALYLLLGNVETKPGQTLRQKFATFFIVMNILYFINFCLTFLPAWGPYCTNDNVYPRVMENLPQLFGITTFFGVFLKCKGFYLNREEDQDETSPLIDSGLEWNEELYKNRDLFVSQMNRYIIMTCVGFTLQMGETIVGKLATHQNDHLGCINGGLEWEFESAAGRAFASFHLINIIVLALLVEACFYRIPKAKGYFAPKEKSDNPNNDTSLNNEGDTTQITSNNMIP